MEPFGSRLHQALAKRGPLCVGIDPHASLLAAWGLSDDVNGLERFTQTVVEALAERVAVFKPQAAFFERFGSRGMAILESTIRQLRDAGALVLLDAKRGDIGSTMAAYADAYLNPSSPIYVDAITVSPFLGFGSLRPALDSAALHGGGVFVLALTSNPEGSQVQQARTADGRTVAQLMLDEISQVNAGAQPLGSIGAVVGATVGRTGADLSRTNGPFLVPGLGAQGGDPAGLREIFGDSIDAVLPSYSREVLAAGPTVKGLIDATERSLSACRSVLHG
ncbi:MAG: orotidine-5'-phosphate decarboxylase [Hamadaea sp.]|uniref:orotidine-5'-phosphate decarboxylase n=1 Tax=Hamadaea sp. TaxID=2024425 RepID=UPI00184EB71E|nr:orotidine-5'-phosphate decarboxylase [Hamadaea sp.]NUR74263.1 orotidine-5'-phosphate decarboxylase [Hamadaea sp.]NUT22600.1 orotidine-5'-phosphate decarboxylase [Hamadaea sp.]